MKLIVAGAVSSPCTRAQVAPLCSNFHLTPLTAQQRGLASAQRGSFFPFPACLRATAPGTHGR